MITDGSAVKMPQIFVLRHLAGLGANLLRDGITNAYSENLNCLRVWLKNTAENSFRRSLLIGR